jgi:hypothetical protein
MLLAAGVGGVPKAEAQAAPANRTLTIAQMKADLEVFRTNFLEVDQAYSAEARSRGEAKLRELEERLSRVSWAKFELSLAQIVALADNGHTTAFAGPRSRRFNRVPIRVTPFGEDFHVLRATAAHADLLGARVVAVGDTRIDEIRDSARTLAGGVAAWRDRNANYLIESPEQMHALGLITEMDAVLYEFETAAGRRVARRLQAEPANDDRVRAGASRWLSPELFPEERGTWRALLDPNQVPWSLRDVDEPFRSRDAAELDATIVELRRNNNAPGRPISAALRELTAAIEAGGHQHLVLDMRLNGGGDLNTTRNFMTSLPDLVPGRIFVLMSPWTFSAAISSIGYLEQAAPERVTLVGEGPGDRLEFFSEGGIVTLPNSGAVLLNATERHDYRTGCEGKVDCHGPVVRNPIAVPSLAPDIAAPWTLAAYAAGRDPGMEAVTAALRDGR